MKIIFAGTPDFAVPALDKIAETFGVAAVLTQPDRPQGRKRILTPSPVKQAALARGIPVLQPIKLREELAPLKEVGADLMVTCAYGQILSQETLDLFPMGVWNVHASLLPKYRGAAPIAAAIAAGEKETGVTIIVITHSMGVVEKICRNVAVVEHGRVVEQGSVADVFANPRSHAAQVLLERVDWDA